MIRTTHQTRTAVKLEKNPKHAMWHSSCHVAHSCGTLMSTMTIIARAKCHMAHAMFVWLSTLHSRHLVHAPSLAKLIWANIQDIAIFTLWSLEIRDISRWQKIRLRDLEIATFGNCEIWKSRSLETAKFRDLWECEVWNNTLRFVFSRHSKI